MQNKYQKNPVEEIADTVEAAAEETERAFEPYQRTIFHRYPVLFTFAVTFGVTATLFGFERLIGEIAWLNDRPLLILLLGITTLVITGTLYKKLG